jgi:predicted RNA-binding protein with PIN domain
MRPRYLIVDGHSIIFDWPELRKLHVRRQSLARDGLIKKLRHYQDWSAMRVVVVFDGQGEVVTEVSDPYDVQIFYAPRGQSADSIVERLAGKYASHYDVTVATSDSLVMETVNASGANCVSADGLRKLIGSVEKT